MILLVNWSTAVKISIEIVLGKFIWFGFVIVFVVVFFFCIHMVFLVCYNWCTFEYKMNTKHSSTCLYLLRIRKADSSNLVDDSIDHQYGFHFYGKLKFYSIHTAFAVFQSLKCTHTRIQHHRKRIMNGKRPREWWLWWWWTKVKMEISKCSKRYNFSNFRNAAKDERWQISIRS